MSRRHNPNDSVIIAIIYSVFTTFLHYVALLLIILLFMLFIDATTTPHRPTLFSAFFKLHSTISLSALLQESLPLI